MTSRIARAALGAFLCTAAGMTGVAPAQAQPRTMAECHGIASSTERLACYDTASGRPAARTTEAAPAPAPAPSAAPAPADAMTRAVAGDAPRAGASIIDTMWSFDPSSPRYDIPTETDLAAVFEVAELAGIVWLKFDADSAVIDGLPVFDPPGDAL